MSYITQTLLQTAAKVASPLTKMLIRFNQSNGLPPIAEAGQILSANQVSCQDQKGVFSRSEGLAIALKDTLPIGDQPWVFDIHYEGSDLPPFSFDSSLAHVVQSYTKYLYLIYFKPDWRDHILVTGETNHSNHLAVGYQGGMLQAWLNGNRIYYGENALTTQRQSLSSMWLGGYGKNTEWSGTILSARLVVGADIYGDHATITPPSPMLTQI